MRILTITLLALSLACSLSAQSAYELPFASKDNTIEMAIENTATFQIKQVKVEVKDNPDWISFRSRETSIDDLSHGKEKTASFIFSVDKKAPVRKDQKLIFVITGPNNQTWTKEITISVAPPERFELFQNYPNPFNPTTVVSYQLTVDGKVSLKVYNLLGQEVATLIDGDQIAGFHEETWNASSTASGTYIYRLVARDQVGKEFVAQKRMVVVK